MYKTHYFTIHNSCPCKIEQEAVKRAKELYEESSCTADFVAKMENQRVIGRLISYDETQHAILIHKQYARESGGGCCENKTLIGERCHCDHYNHSTGYFPKYYCKCGAEFYRPMFAPIFGDNVLLEAYKTVLSGDVECVIAVRLDEKETK